MLYRQYRDVSQQPRYLFRIVGEAGGALDMLEVADTRELARGLQAARRQISAELRCARKSAQSCAVICREPD